MPSGTVTILLAGSAVLPSRHTNNRKSGVVGEASFGTGATAPTKTIGNTKANICCIHNIHHHHRQDCRETVLRVAGHRIIIVWDWANIFVSGSLSMDRTEGYLHRPTSHPNVNGKIVFVSYYVANPRLLCNGRGGRNVMNCYSICALFAVSIVL